MVDSLESFSHQWRQAPLEFEWIQLDTLVREVWSELEPEKMSGDAVLPIGRLPQCHADRRLVRGIFVNLLGNALVHTKTVYAALVEVGGLDSEGRTVFFIKANRPREQERQSHGGFGVVMGAERSCP